MSLGEKVGQLCSESDELHQLLHESQEGEIAAVKEVEMARTKVNSLREEVKQLKKETL